MMRFDEILAGRRSVKRFDPAYTVSDERLRALFEKVIHTPSSFNLQHWRFVVVRDPSRKAELREASYDQEQVETASAVIVVAARLRAHEDAPKIYADTPEEVRRRLLPMIRDFYEKNEQLQRDEAVRSASLAAMTLMYAAYDMGCATCPMIGFDPRAVSKLVGLDQGHIPVMLICLGKAVGNARTRGHRYPLSHVVKLETLDGRSLT